MIVEVTFTATFDSSQFLGERDSEYTLEEFCQRIDDHLWENGDIVSNNLKFKDITNEN